MLKRFLFALSLLPSISAAQSIDYPEFVGVYLRVGSEFTELRGLSTHRGYILPPEPPGEYRLYQEFGPTNFLGTTISSNNSLFMGGGISVSDYIASIEGFSPTGAQVVSIVAVQRPPFSIGNFLSGVASRAEMIGSLRTLTPEERTRCAENAARGVAPMAGGFNICRAGEFGFESSDVEFITSNWGRPLSDIVRERIVGPNTTEYIFDASFAGRCQNRTADLTGRERLRNYGHIFTASNGLSYIIACGERQEAEIGAAARSAPRYEELFDVRPGDYAIHPSQCHMADAVQPEWVWQTFGPRPLTINHDSMSWDHSFCEIDSLQRIGAEHRFQLSCSYANDTWSEIQSVVQRGNLQLSFGGHVLTRCPPVAWHEVSEPDFEMPIRAGRYSNSAAGCNRENADTTNWLEIPAPADVSSECQLVGYHMRNDAIELITACQTTGASIYRLERLTDESFIPSWTDEAYQHCPFDDTIGDQATIAASASSLLAPSGSMWVQLASRATLRSAQAFVELYAPEARIFRSDSGWYTVVATQLSEGEYDTLENLVASRGWPEDSLLTRGDHFVEEFPATRASEVGAEGGSVGAATSDVSSLTETLRAEYPDFYRRLADTLDDDRLDSMLVAMELNAFEDPSVLFSSPVFQEMLVGFTKLMLSPGFQRLMEQIGFPNTDYIYAFELPNLSDLEAMSVEIGLDYAFELGVLIVERGIEDYPQPWDGTASEAFFDAAIPAFLREAKSALASYADYRQGNYVSFGVGLLSDAADTGLDLYEAWTIFNEVTELNRGIVEDATRGAVAAINSQETFGPSFLRLSTDYSVALADISQPLMNDSQAWTVDAGRKLRIISEVVLIRAIQLEGRDVSGHVETLNALVSEYEETPISVLASIGNRLSFGAVGTREYASFSQSIATELGLEHEQ